MAADSVCPPSNIESDGAGADIEHERHEAVEDQSSGRSIRTAVEELGAICGIDDFEEGMAGAGERRFGSGSVRSAGRSGGREGVGADVVAGVGHVPGEIGVATGAR
ncbi:hypothetical protein G352_00622 [Rhodococcus ruber BKS 20-38]|uniref:Uncharacterized protein n=1 Tax=Rhodococcus ruber BKS 20-38 TaxID=1278076 RepID=M3A368_9NOCA|nr:hypothetical protein [Rhodococcus ruber]EME67343.1 hypothetical protein G352_00622 [Rhodococcus ruber BKS 20-38]